MNGISNLRYNSEGLRTDDPLLCPGRLFRHRSLNNNYEGLRADDPLSCLGRLSRHPSLNNNYLNSIPPLSSPSPLSRNSTHSVSRNEIPLVSRCPSPSPLSRSLNQMQQNSAATAAAIHLKRRNRRSSFDGASFPSSSSSSFHRSISRKNSTPITYSTSTGALIKPKAIEKQVDCTLEQLCFGCIKKIKITRDAVTRNGQIVQEDEMLTIKVKPGWRKGTKITFEDMGNESPGSSPGDITFIIAEKQHPLFRRVGDDLELRIEIPLVKALTGGSLSIPLLDGNNMVLTLEEIILPGYEKTITGQGMSKSKEQGNRGNLIIKFFVQFPTELTDKQRSEVFNILQDSGLSTK